MCLLAPQRGRREEQEGEEQEGVLHATKDTLCMWSLTFKNREVSHEERALAGPRPDGPGGNGLVLAPMNGAAEVLESRWNALFQLRYAL